MDGAAVVGAGMGALLPAAFLAGLLSFLSPCTLPILPAYFAYTFQARQQDVLLTSVSFFFGLATTLVLLGASATALGGLLFRHLREVTLVGGLVVIAFGVMSLFGRGFGGPLLLQRPVAGVLGSYVYGASFAIGWSTCIGPILGALLTLLATGGLALAQGALLAFVYALGLGAPLILVASLFGRLGSGTPFWRLIRGRGFEVSLPRLGALGSLGSPGGAPVRTVRVHSSGVLSALLMIPLGVLIASGQLTSLTQSAAGSELSLWVIEVEEALHGRFGLR